MKKILLLLSFLSANAIHAVSQVDNDMSKYTTVLNTKGKPVMLSDKFHALMVEPILGYTENIRAKLLVNGTVLVTGSCSKNMVRCTYTYSKADVQEAIRYNSTLYTLVVNDKGQLMSLANYYTVSDKAK